jgi:putative addiction module component (TIGR02574 family)
MSKAEILVELPKLPPEDRAEIQSRIEELATGGTDGWLDADDPLTDEQKALLDARLDDLDKHPEKSIPWSEAETRLKARFGQ